MSQQVECASADALTYSQQSASSQSLDELERRMEMFANTSSIKHKLEHIKCVVNDVAQDQLQLRRLSAMHLWRSTTHLPMLRSRLVELQRSLKWPPIH